VAVTPTGIYSLLLEDLRDLLAACASWRTWTAAADAAAAKALVYRSETDRATAGDVFALVGFGDDAEFESSLHGRGTLKLRFMANVPDALKDEDGEFEIGEAETDFSNHVGAVLAELLALGGTGGYLYVRNVASEAAPQGPSEDDVADPRFAQTWRVYWGREAGG